MPEAWYFTKKEIYLAHSIETEYLKSGNSVDSDSGKGPHGYVTSLHHIIEDGMWWECVQERGNNHFIRQEFIEHGGTMFPLL
jgi:hypothetical protein